MSVGSFNTPRGNRLVRLAAALGAFAAFMQVVRTAARKTLNENTSPMGTMRLDWPPIKSSM